jgi:phenylalanyl-tRNA synthetase alpha chain
MDEKEALREIEKIRDESEKDLGSVSDSSGLEAWSVKYLGRKGILLAFSKRMPEVPASDRPGVGAALNGLKEFLRDVHAKKAGTMGAGEETGVPGINPTLPGLKTDSAHYHPLTIVAREICDVFRELGFGIRLGPEIETDYYNFEALNTPKDHPARDMWDTFYLDAAKGVLLRTHTSPVQIRTMEKMKPPFRIIAFGKCFRRDAPDASHTPVFHQIEGLMVGEGITFAHLKGVLVYFLKRLFRNDVQVRFLPSYFPFTEPSAEISISCVICGGKGCSTCGGTGWIEILGAGMVHPEVFRYGGLDPEKVTGFAFGVGVERIAMLKYGIDDIRDFYFNDYRFLSQLG